ncbi:MAG TPA: DUF5678 domain-containing protein [Blastocatellia bacterium]|nr:DUF5678 domain-containing protein [Blastocatellia bacterium]
MNTERLNAIKQQLNALTADEKLDLVEYLQEQAQKDKAMEAAAAQTNGQEEKPDPYCLREREWLRQHRYEYAGQYVALDGGRLIAFGPDGRVVIRQAREAGVKAPYIARIEAADELPFGGW